MQRSRGSGNRLELESNLVFTILRNQLLEKLSNSLLADLVTAGASSDSKSRIRSTD